MFFISVLQIYFIFYFIFRCSRKYYYYLSNEIGNIENESNKDSDILSPIEIFEESRKMRFLKTYESTKNTVNVLSTDLPLHLISETNDTITVDRISMCSTVEMMADLVSRFLDIYESMSDDENEVISEDENEVISEDENEVISEDENEVISEYNEEILSEYDDEKAEDDEIMSKEWNVNIDPILYERKGLKQYLENNDNILENQWKSRKLMESTPYGNIIMQYNIFNEGFVYYSDQSGIPYSVLNAMAMKYVLIFRCRDLFIDESIIPHGNTSPFITFILEDEKNEQNKRKEANKSLTNLPHFMEDSPFAILKDRSSQNPSQCTTHKPNPVIPVIEKMKNKFIYLGKIHNCDILQIIPKKKVECLNTSTYSNYKKMKILCNINSPILDPMNEYHENDRNYLMDRFFL
jgi:hypothetical protein